MSEDDRSKNEFANYEDDQLLSFRATNCDRTF